MVFPLRLFQTSVSPRKATKYETQVHPTDILPLNTFEIGNQFLIYKCGRFHGTKMILKTILDYMCVVKCSWCLTLCCSYLAKGLLYFVLFKYNIFSFGISIAIKIINSWGLNCNTDSQHTTVDKLQKTIKIKNSIPNIVN